MNQPPSNRTVAIVGRPNVGKSAMFNRIVGRRLSIVHEEEGVTRDRVCCEGDFFGKPFDLIDTGGLGFMDGEMSVDVIEGGIRKQVEAAIADASAIIFAVDVSVGVQPLDEEVAKMLHTCGRYVVLAANKADNAAVTEQALDFERLGFPVFPVAALHNIGFDDLMEDVVEHLPPVADKAAQEVLKVAIVGKPNAGKSSYINRLLRNDRLIVSDIPGTTRDSVEIPFSIGSRHYQLIDTAGMRHIRRANTAVELFSVLRAKRSIERADVVCLVIDAEKGPSKQDKKIAALALEHRKGCAIFINKWDLADDKVTQREYLAALRKHVPFLSFAPVVFISAHSGLNIRKSIDVIDQVAANITSKLTTGELNRKLHESIDRVPPPASGKTRLKFYYATQIGERPIRISLFVNKPEVLTHTYHAFLINQLRDTFKLEGAPVVLNFKSSHERKGEEVVHKPRRKSSREIAKKMSSRSSPKRKSRAAPKRSQRPKKSNRRAK